MVPSSICLSVIQLSICGSHTYEIQYLQHSHHTQTLTVNFWLNPISSQYGTFQPGPFTKGILQDFAKVKRSGFAGAEL